MNKKGLLGITIAAALTVASTATVAFAGQASADSTKNVIKITSDQKSTEKNAETASKGSNVKVTFDINSSQKAAENSSKANVKLLDISDAKAIQMAEAAIKYYTGTDVEKVMARDGLKPYITRYNSQYAWGSDILVMFNGNSNTKDNIFASISAADGKIYNVTAMTDRDYSKTNIDENKVKQAAAEFLNTKGFGSNFQSITVDNEKVSAGLVGAKALYEDGTEILIEFKSSDYSVVNFTHYNMKTMKFLTNRPCHVQ